MNGSGVEEPEVMVKDKESKVYLYLTRLFHFKNLLLGSSMIAIIALFTLRYLSNLLPMGSLGTLKKVTV